MDEAEESAGGVVDVEESVGGVVGVVEESSAA